MGEGTWPGLGLPCYLPFPSGKGTEASRGVPEPVLSTFPHTLPVSSPEAPASGQGQTAEHLGSKWSGWGLLAAVEAWIPRFRVLLGSVARKWHHFLGSYWGPLHKAPQGNLWVDCSPTLLGHVQAQWHPHHPPHSLERPGCSQGLSSEDTAAFRPGSFFSSVMWPWTSHVPFRVSPVSPSAEWGSFSHLLPRTVGLQDLHAFQPGAGITWSLCTGTSQRKDSIQGWPSTEWGRNRPGWALGPRKRHSLSCLSRDPDPPVEDWKKTQRSPSLIQKRAQLSGPLFPLRFWFKCPILASVGGWAYNGSLHSCLLLL